jgi:hypothetical protein
MRKLILFACAVVTVAALTLSSGASGQKPGVLSVDQGRGIVILDVRGVVLGRLTSGTLRVTDQTPRDRFEEIVNGRIVEAEYLGPKTTIYRGQGLRFRMVGGRFRIIVRGSGIAISAMGRGSVQLDGEPRVVGDPTGVYSINDGIDCSIEPTRCTPFPDERESFTLGGPGEPPEPRSP